MQATRDTFPFVLTDSATYQVPTNRILTASPVIFPSARLVNPLQVPFEVTELRFMATTSRNDVTAPVLPSIDVLLRVGRRSITNGYVPLFAITPIRPTIPQFDSSGISGAYASTQFVRWILPVPFILAPTEGFTGGFMLNSNLVGYTPTGSALSVSLSVTAVGRRYPGRMPAKRRVPYASGGWLQTAGAILPEHTLENTFPVDLTVTSIQAIGINSAIPYPFGPGILDTSGSGTVNGTTMRIAGPGGLLGANRRTILSSGWGEAAFGGRAAIDIPHVLKPHDWYKIMIDTSGDTTSPTSSIAVGLTGYREE